MWEEYKQELTEQKQALFRTRNEVKKHQVQHDPRMYQLTQSIEAYF